MKNFRLNLLKWFKIKTNCRLRINFCFCSFCLRISCCLIGSFESSLGSFVTEGVDVLFSLDEDEVEDVLIEDELVVGVAGVICKPYVCCTFDITLKNSLYRVSTLFAHIAMLLP